MPFDPTPDINEVSRNGVEIGKLRALSEALKGEMKDWKWKFRSWTDNEENPSCGTAGCAIGLAYAHGLLQGKFDIPVQWMVGRVSPPFGMALSDAVRCFTNVGYCETVGLDLNAVTPTMVAREIDRVIARETAP